MMTATTPREVPTAMVAVLTLDMAAVGVDVTVAMAVGMLVHACEIALLGHMPPSYS
jgi:hypothetical protein